MAYTIETIVIHGLPLILEAEDRIYRYHIVQIFCGRASMQLGGEEARRYTPIDGRVCAERS
jgi:hypothetical protein